MNAILISYKYTCLCCTLFILALQASEDNIYEEVDLQQINQADDDFGDNVSWVESEVGLDQSASSASEEVEEETGASKLAARFIGKKKKSSKKGKENEVYFLINFHINFKLVTKLFRVARPAPIMPETWSKNQVMSQRRRIQNIC